MTRATCIAVLLAFSTVVGISAFSPSAQRHGRAVTRTAPSRVAVNDVADYEKLMADFLVKSNEERERAVEEARSTATSESDARIAALEQQLSSLGGPASAASEDPMYTARSAKSPAALSERWGAEELERLASAPPAAAPPAAVAVPAGAGGDAQDELRAELEELRVFCSTYLVNAAEEKVHAVEEAKAEVRAEYEVQIAALKAQLAGGAAPPAAAAPAAAAASAASAADHVHPMYAKRTPSSSRWGAEELERVGAATPASGAQSVRDGLTAGIPWGTAAAGR